MTGERRLALVRVGIALVLIARTTPLLAPLHLPFLPSTLLGWPESGFHVPAFGLALPDGILRALAIVRTAAAFTLLLGLRSRTSALVASLSGYVLLGQDQLAYVNSLHLLYLATFLLALADARSMRSNTWLLRALPLSVYVFSGISKLNASFLSGRALMVLHDQGGFRGPVANLACASARVAQVTSLAVVLLELGLPLALALRKSRRNALVGALLFHGALETTMHPDVFGWTMAVLLVAFFPTHCHARAASLHSTAS